MEQTHLKLSKETSCSENYSNATDLKKNHGKAITFSDGRCKPSEITSQ